MKNYKPEFLHAVYSKAREINKYMGRRKCRLLLSREALRDSEKEDPEKQVEF